MNEQNTEKGLVKQEPRKPINVDLSGGIMPQNYDELMQFSALYKNSGLAPKSLETVEKLAIAMAMCLEVGRPIMTGLQDMAVINGTVTIYGDAALALVRSSGLLESFNEYSEGTPFNDDWIFYCKLKRVGFDEAVGSWSWLESKRAGHDKLQAPSPWAKFTRRMMIFKARNWVLRDQFGDVLKGMRMAEDASDAIDLVNVNGTFKEDRTDDEKLDALTGAVSSQTPAEGEGIEAVNTPMDQGGPGAAESTGDDQEPDPDPSLICPHCDHKPFKTAGAVKVHITKFHPKTKESPAGDPPGDQEEEEPRPNPLTDGQEENQPEETKEPETERPQAPEVCQSCNGEACGAAYNLVYAGADGPMCDSHALPDLEADDTKEKPPDKWLTCEYLSNKPKKDAVNYCPKCVRADDCKEFNEWKAAH